jgi:LmbE family N-acetylglucosaminyl deacetylase
MKILVVAWHPDDEALGCGGTITRRSREGHKIAIAILGEGVTSRYDQRERADPALVKGLHGKAGEVAKLLKIVKTLVAGFKPDAIYTHHGGDLNVDHQLVSRAVLTATRPVQGHAVRELYMFRDRFLDGVCVPTTFSDLQAECICRLKVGQAA